MFDFFCSVFSFQYFIDQDRHKTFRVKIDKSNESDDQNIWTKSKRAYLKILTLNSKSCFLIKYIIITCYAWRNNSTPYAARKGEINTWQRHPTKQQQKKMIQILSVSSFSAAAMLDINDDYDERAWWSEREGGWGGVEKRFFFNIKFLAAKATDIFCWSGSMFKLNPERIISSFLLFENVLKLGR